MINLSQMYDIYLYTYLLRNEIEIKAIETPIYFSSILFQTNISQFFSQKYI